MPKSIAHSTVVLLDGLRTPVGHPYKGLREFSAAQLASFVIKKIIQNNKIDPKRIHEVILGNVVGAGTGQNLTRQAAIAAGLPVAVPSFTVNNVCGAGLQSVILAAQSIMARRADVVIAGGTESATQSPYFVKREEAENYKSKVRELNTLDCLQQDGLFCRMTGQRMGELVENLAHKFHISREEQDDYAFESHRKTCLAQKKSKFKHEIVSVRSKKDFVSVDEHPRKNLDREWLDKLPPVFWTGGTVTAGNSSLSCDGAAAVLVASPEWAKKHKLKPRARIVDYVSIAVPPARTFEATVDAVSACLDRCRLSLQDVDLFEISEAFAAQAIFAQRKLKIPPEKINVFGGDLAIGHPLGAAGARILVTLMSALEDRKKKRGMACIPYGGGGAIAMVIERMR